MTNFFRIYKEKYDKAIAFVVLLCFLFLNIEFYGLNFYSWLLVVITLTFFSWEILRPAFPVQPISLSERWSINFMIGFVNSYISSIPVIMASTLCYNHGWGIFNLIDFPPSFVLISTILLLDLSFYIMHRFAHYNRWLWKSHRVHHCDLGYDFSLAARDHPISAVCIGLGRVLFVVIIGCSPLGVFIYMVLSSITLNFIHANINIPNKIDYALRFIFITPNVHYIHHSSLEKDTNSNYGIIFIWWDKLFGTYVPTPTFGYKKMDIGLEDARSTSDVTLKKLLLSPLKK